MKIFQMLSIILLLIFSHTVYSGEIRGTVKITEKQETGISISSRSIIRKYVTKDDTYHEHAVKPSDTLAVVVYIDDIEFEGSENKAIAVLLEESNPTLLAHNGVLGQHPNPKPGLFKHYC